MTKELRVLVVARWPLGGIRTYMRYMYSHFPSNYKLTVIASSTQEDDALIKDVKEYGAVLKLVQITGPNTFIFAIFKELLRNKYDLVLSQGFISAVAVNMANLVFRRPHILTIHGILEPRYLNGSFGTLKRFFLAQILSRVTVLYAVSNDILEHLYGQFPKLKKNGPQSIVIPNGIEPSDFEKPPNVPVNLRQKLDIGNSTYLFGFFGRFMAQKGFDLLIEAVNCLRHEEPEYNFAVVAVGSGDYLREYQGQIERMGLEQYFHFLPFQQQVHNLYRQVDVIVMPSRWEASGLLAMEALCMGTPLIASNCLGLRETVFDTPTMVFPSENVGSLFVSMRSCMQNTNNEVFREYMPKARVRYDVDNSTARLVKFIEDMQEKK